MRWAPSGPGGKQTSPTCANERVAQQIQTYELPKSPVDQGKAAFALRELRARASLSRRGTSTAGSPVQRRSRSREELGRHPRWDFCNCAPYGAVRHNGAMKDVFLSYSAADRAVAKRLELALRSAGVTVSSPRDTPPDEAMSTALATAIAQSRAFVLIHPGQMGSSGAIRLETDTAIALSATHGLLVFPVLLPGREPIGDVGRFRYLQLKSIDDLMPIVQVIIKALATRKNDAPTASGLHLSFLTALLRSDLRHSPRAAALVLDEISQTVGSDLEDFGRQLALLREAANWADSNMPPDHPSATSVRYRLTNALLRSGQYAESAALSRQSLASARRPRDSIQACFNLGNALVPMGQLREARSSFKQCLRMSREVGSFTSEAAALVALGSVERRLGSSEDARRHYEQALQVTAAISQPTMRANALLRLIELTAETGDVGSRREYAQEALLLAQTSLAGDAELALQVAGALADEGGDQ